MGSGNFLIYVWLSSTATYLYRNWVDVNDEGYFINKNVTVDRFEVGCLVKRSSSSIS